LQYKRESEDQKYRCLPWSESPETEKNQPYEASGRFDGGSKNISRAYIAAIGQRKLNKPCWNWKDEHRSHPAAEFCGTWSFFR
jgi:hypothetical protein